MKSIGTYYFLFYLGLASFFPYISIYFSDKGISPTVIGAILALWALTGVISQPIMGIISDRLSDNRKILMVSTLVPPILALGFYFFDGYVALIALSILLPMLQSPSGPISDSIAVEVGKKRGISFGSVRLWGAFGFAFGTFLTGFVYGKIGYDKSFFLYLAINLLVFMTLFRFPRTEKKHTKLSITGQAKQVFSNKLFMVFVGISFLMAMASASNFNFLPIYFKEMGYNKDLIGTAFAIAAIIEVPMFWISAKLNSKIARYYVMSFAALLYSIEFLVLAFSPSMYVVLAMQLLNGISFAFFASTSVETVQSFSSERTKATYQTIFAAVTSGLGNIVGSAVGGIVIDNLGITSLYFILFLLCAASSIFFVVFKITSSRRAQHVERTYHEA